MLAGISSNYLRRGALAAARSPRLLSSTRLAPSYNTTYSAGMKVRPSAAATSPAWVADNE